MSKKTKPKSQIRVLLGQTFKQTYAKIGAVIIISILS
ncbi:MAG: hypothetical protein RLZZ73_710, partial [Actinomycetota bacterium]